MGLALGGHPLLTPSGVAADLQGLDSDYYLHFAERVRAGDMWLLDPASFFGQPAPAFFISPLYIYALALFLAIGGGSLAFARGVQLALGVAAVWLVMRTTRRWYGDRAAWIAGALMAGCGLFTFYESLILQASLDPFLTSLDLYTLTRALQDGRRRDWAAGGAALGLHALNRPNVLIVAAAVILASALMLTVTLVRFRSVSRDPRPVPRGPVPSVRSFSVFSVCMVLVLAPATIRNYRATGELVLISSHGGLNFLIGNGPEADGTFVRAIGVPPTIRGQWIDAVRVASEREGRSVTAGEASSFFRRQASDWIAANPAAELELLSRKAWFTLSNVFLTLNYSYPFYARDIGSPLGFLLVGPTLLLALGVAGLTVGRPRGQGAWLLAVFSVSSVLSVCLFFVAARYRIPFQVALVVAAGGAVSWATDRARARGWAPLLAATLVAGAASVVAAWPTGLDNGRTEEQVRMGLHEIDRGLVTDGERWISNALNTYGHPFPGVVHLRAAQAHEAAGRNAEALDHYRRASAIDPDEPTLRIGAARVLNGLQQPAEAVASLDRVAEGVMNESTGREYERAGLAAIMTRGDKAIETALDAFSKAEARLPKSPSVRLNKAVVLAMAGRTKEARAAAESALALDPAYTRARDFLDKVR
ncbi:MAG TPA: glycosyltransferase family 39 protein [Vicinamibacterales bacterium]|nr:glycosyltransferase family 39 protein [Vicinamibacterales bacterium]